MTNHDAVEAVRPMTLAWVSRHLEVGERVRSAEALRGGITADMQRLTIGTRDGGTRDLVLRSFVTMNTEHAGDGLLREADALTLLRGTGVPAPGLVAVDPTAAQCEHPSLLMTHLAGRTILEDEGLEARVPVLARQLVAIHALRPAVRPLAMCCSTCAPQARQAPGSPASSTGHKLPGARRTSDVAHCSTNLALLHGPAWGLRFADAYEEAGGVLASARSERLYWHVRDVLAISEEVQWVSQPWRDAGRTELTTRAVEQRLDAYVTVLMDALG
ncbi:phosphotransferase [Streptomyces sp. NEAU-Y11]|nr:phosphotransferase [Streptomyces sp. NEAU-Y11]MCP9212409.1 phosphotransferase [Streptomyces sp. NEAU-Y11]